MFHAPDGAKLAILVTVQQCAPLPVVSEDDLRQRRCRVQPNKIHSGGGFFAAVVGHRQRESRPALISRSQGRARLITVGSLPRKLQGQVAASKAYIVFAIVADAIGGVVRWRPPDNTIEVSPARKVGVGRRVVILDQTVEKDAPGSGFDRVGAANHSEPAIQRSSDKCVHVGMKLGGSDGFIDILSARERSPKVIRRLRKAGGVGGRAVQHDQEGNDRTQSHGVNPGAQCRQQTGFLLVSQPCPWVQKSAVFLSPDRTMESAMDDHRDGSAPAAWVSIIIAPERHADAADEGATAGDDQALMPAAF